MFSVETFPETLFKTRVLGLDKLADLHPDPDAHILTLDKNIPTVIQLSQSQIYTHAHTCRPSDHWIT